MPKTISTKKKLITVEIGNRELHKEMKLLSIKLNKDLKDVAAEAFTEYLHKYNNNSKTQTTAQNEK